MTNQRRERLTEGIEIVLLIAVVGLNIWWMVYRYGGETYYVQNGKALNSYSISLPTGVAGTGHTYLGLGINRHGAKRRIKFRTDAVAPAPFSKSKIVKVTVNAHYGVTNYEPVKNAKRLPVSVRNQLVS